MKPCKHFQNYAGKKKQITSLDKHLSSINNHKCGLCLKSNGRLFVCGLCNQELCMENEHLKGHFTETKHDIYFDVNLKEFFCQICKDYVIFEEDSKVKSFLPNICIEEKQIKEIPEKYQNWGMKKFILKLGLRGLYNLGSTCFMNTIIQAIAHNPIFSSYYLNNNIQEDEDLELANELHKTVIQLYNGETKPYNPHQLLYQVWNNLDNFSTYSEQDAHEFLMSLLDQDGISQLAEISFKGELQSDVVCTECKTKYSTYDPFLDIPLQIKHVNSNMKSIHECLCRFVKKEILDSDYFCYNCNSKGHATKQLSIKTLPIVLCFHLKRFQQTKDQMLKVDTHLDFPFQLDMSPYSQTLSKCLYNLFCVVEHKGTLESGHYRCYIQQNSKWYLCDDERVYRAQQSEIKDCQAYILFYIRKDL